MQIRKIELNSLNKTQLGALKTKNVGKNPYVQSPIVNTEPQQDIFLKSANNQKNSQEKSSIRESFENIKQHQGFIGKAWDGIKNILGMKSGSKKVEEQIEKFERGKISKEEAEKIIQKYQDGQKMCVDVAADIVSGIVSVAAFAFAVPTGGASLGIGLALATFTGAASKVGIKYGDSLISRNKYELKDLAFDTATGAINGLISPISNGFGASLTKTIGKKLGLTIVEEGVTQVTSQGVKSGIKSAILTRTVDVTGGTAVKRAIALGSGMALDGALSGASDNAVRAAFNGEDIGKAAIQGLIGGAITSPVIGGGFRAASKAGRRLNNLITTKRVLPNGIATRFRQGQAGDCALLSMIDGMLGSEEASRIIRESITKTPGGDYNVRIGDRIVRVAKSSLGDEILSDTTGIKIFEQAYRQVAGDLDGGFADVVARQFGLNPVHITNEAISDELLDRLASERGNAILSLGAVIDESGAITDKIGQRHYFTIKDIDPKTRKITVTNPLDTSKTMSLSYDEVRKLGISIDGGTLSKSEGIPNFARNMDDEVFRGLNTSRTKKLFIENTGLTEEQVEKIFAQFSDDITLDGLSANLELYGISPEEAANFIRRQMDGDQNGVKAFNNLMQTIQLQDEFRKSSIFDAFNLSLEETDKIRNFVKNGEIDKIYDVLFEKDSNLALKLAENNFLENSYKNITDIVDNSVYRQVSPDSIISLGTINGRERFAILPNATSIPRLKIPKGQETKFLLDMIKSNMMTKDIIDELLKDEKLLLELIPTNKTMKLVGKIGYDVNPVDIIRKAQQKGVDSLTSHETHILTDVMSELYSGKNANSKFQRLVNNLLTSKSSQYNNIYSYVEHLKKLSSGITNKYGVVIEDHAFMRMLDRNLLSVTDNKNFKRLNFEEFIDLISQNAKNGKNEISGYNGSSGIKLITRVENGKTIIDTVI